MKTICVLTVFLMSGAQASYGQAETTDAQDVGWQVIASTDTMTDDEVQCAMTTNKDGFFFGIYRSNVKYVYGYFSMPLKSVEVLGSRLPTYRVDKREARDFEDAKFLSRGLAKEGMVVYQFRANSVAFLLSVGTTATTEGYLRDIMDGETIVFRYYLSTDRVCETSFDLRGARPIIASAIGVPDGTLEELKAKTEAASEASKEAEQDAIEAARQRILNAKRRTWTSGQFKVEAEFLTAIQGKVTLRRLDNDNEIVVPMELLSKEDQKFIRERKWMAPQVITDQPTRGDTASTGRFVGRWRILNDQGVVCAHFSLTASHEARKDHAPAATATWEIVGNDARITWSDGWRDVFRAQRNETLVITFRPGASWNDPPHNILRAVRE